MVCGTPLACYGRVAGGAIYMLLLILLFFIPEYWLVWLSAALGAAFSFTFGGPTAAIAHAGITLLIGLPLVAFRRWMKEQGAKRRERAIDAELARIRAEP